jgi:hypothetical protein
VHGVHRSLAPQHAQHDARHKPSIKINKSPETTTLNVIELHPKSLLLLMYLGTRVTLLLQLLRVVTWTRASTHTLALPPNVGRARQMDNGASSPATVTRHR